MQARIVSPRYIVVPTQKDWSLLPPCFATVNNGKMTIDTNGLVFQYTDFIFKQFEFSFDDKRCAVYFKVVVLESGPMIDVNAHHRFRRPGFQDVTEVFGDTIRFEMNCPQIDAIGDKICGDVARRVEQYLMFN